MENTIENKAKFFAQYWGKIYGYIPKHNNKEVFQQEVGCVQWIAHLKGSEEMFLRLTPLSLISDEDAIEVARISWSYNEFQKSKYEMKEIMIEDAKELLLKDNPFGYPKQPQLIDYLRSKGYALPFNGLSVEKQIEYGWIKQREL